MSHIRIDKQKAVKKWTPVLENMGVTGERIDWMAEYAEYHSINENAYVNASNVSGMGAVIAAQPSALAGQTIAGSLGSGITGTLTGSGDVGQNLLPVAMKIAAQTIGLDLVAVKPSPGPKIDLLYVDFRYDDTHMGASDERPQVFKFNQTTWLSAIQSAIRTDLTVAGSGGGLTTDIVESTGGLQNGRVFYNITSGAAPVYTEPTGSKAGIVEFLGFSRIDGFPMFRAYRQFNTAHTAVGSVGAAGALWSFDPARNTFNPTASMVDQIVSIGGVTASGGTVELVSALEDHIPGFAANWNSSTNGFSGNYPMDRDMDDKRYAGVIGPKISSKTIAVGTIEVTSALRRTEIEDIKANTGMDIVQKMESILVNELSQTISKQIVAKIFEMGDLNRTSAPLYSGGSALTGQTIFDLNTAYVSIASVGGETTHAVQRKLITKIAHASNYIATEGRVGPAQYLITNGGLAAALSDISGYTINPVKSKLNGQGQLYPVGSIGDISIYVDPYMKYNDNRIVLGRKNNPDQPGIIFVPYLMAQSISIISEATFAPRMLLRSRYAVAEVGWFPQKQFMTIKVTDASQLLN
jgi:hypothetical protein